MSTRTITLTDRPPVKIDEDNWPVIASASDDIHDGQVECQANRKSHWWIKVRQYHQDNRTIVYAGYTYDTHFQSERGLSHKRGVYLDVSQDVDTDAIINAIRTVAADMARGEHKEDDAAQWNRLAQECIADLPAEELDAPKEGNA